MDLTVIIVNFNVKFFLEQALHSVIKAGSPLKVEVIVVDNNSTDGSKEYLNIKFPQVNFIWNDFNPGFAASCNLGLQSAQGEFILFLNPDTIVPEDCFVKCLNFIKTTSNCGALGVKMLDGSGGFLKESKRGFPGAIASFFRLSGLTFLFPKSKTISSYYAGNLSKNEDNEIDIIAGAFFMVKKSILNKVGGFDEQFFMYGEDIDLSYRIQKEGYKNFYFSQSPIIHFKGESTNKSNSYNNIFYNAMHLFVNKHYKGFYKIPMHFAIKTGRFFSSIKLKIKSSNNKNINSLNKNIAIVSNPESINQIEKLLSLSILNKYPRHNLAVNSNHTELEALLANIDDNLVSHILFSEGNLSYKQIISWIEEHQGKYKFLFHSNKCSSIIWSDYKDANGNFISE
ncbi:MAG: glycosyltransferase family 2 protein [Ferruginibacter sp.]